MVTDNKYSFNFKSSICYLDDSMIEMSPNVQRGLSSIGSIMELSGQPVQNQIVRKTSSWRPGWRRRQNTRDGKYVIGIYHNDRKVKVRVFANE